MNFDKLIPSWAEAFVDDFTKPGTFQLKTCDPQHGHSCVEFSCKTEQEMINYLKKNYKK